MYVVIVACLLVVPVLGWLVYMVARDSGGSYTGH